MIYILLWISLILLCTFIFLFFKEKNRKDKIENANNQIYQEKEKITKEIKQLAILKENIQEQIEEKNNNLKEIQHALDNSIQISQQAFENFHNSLENTYKEKEHEYNAAIELLNKSYTDKQNEICLSIEQIEEDLNKISATRTAAIKAQLKEEEIQKQELFYSLSLEDIEKREVKILQSIENELRDARPVRMIIWQSYYSKKANDLSARVLGSKDVCGIYKITSKNSKMCYIGQSKNIRERFREHMKCGLGIDTPANNKLYQAMAKEGIDNFTFELLELCNPADLDEKEQFYINLYDSYHYGFNSNSGNKKP